MQQIILLMDENKRLWVSFDIIFRLYAYHELQIKDRSMLYHNALISPNLY